MKYTIAEIADRLSILLVKYNITTDESIKYKLNHQMDICKHYLKPYTDLEELVNNLYEVNKEIFKLIDFLLTSEDYYTMGISAKKCQILNLERSRLKREIDVLLNVAEKDMEIKI